MSANRWEIRSAGDFSESEIQDMQRRMHADAELRRRWKERRSQSDKWEIIRDAYSLHLPSLLMYGRGDPYFLDWDLTPIESLVWQDIRGTGLPLYPQFPVMQFFLDFADPVRQIAVEADGAAFHETRRDTARDEEMWRHGWRVFRVPGYKTLPSKTNPFEERYARHYALDEWEHERWLRDVLDFGERRSEGFFWALKEVYYSAPRDSADRDSRLQMSPSKFCIEPDTSTSLLSGMRSKRAETIERSARPGVKLLASKALKRTPASAEGMA